jgi:hypothetical protein
MLAHDSNQIERVQDVPAVPVVEKQDGSGARGGPARDAGTRAAGAGATAQAQGWQRDAMMGRATVAMMMAAIRWRRQLQSGGGGGGGGGQRDGCK